MKGLSLSILKHDGMSFSNNGISETFNDCVAFGENIEGYIDITFEDIKNGYITYPNGVVVPLVEVKEEYSTGTKYFRAYPVGKSVEGKWLSFGGCYITTSDSRFSRVAEYPVPLHDRTE